MSTFVYKFEMSEEDWLRIHGKLDEALRLLHELANDDYTVSEAIAADDALSDLESAIDGYGFKYDFKYDEPKTSEEKVTLEMDMQDYGYIVNVLKSMQRNIVGRANVEPCMMANIDMCLKTLEKSIVDEPEEGIEMSEEEWNKIRNGAISGRYEWKDNMPIYGPDPWKEINNLKETIKTQADMISDAHGRILPLTDMYNDHEDRLSELYEEVNNIKDFVTKLDIDITQNIDNLKDQFNSYDNADMALYRRILSIENRLNDLYKLNDSSNNRITSLNIKLDNKTDILEERLKNTTETVDSVKTQLEHVDFSNSQLWDIVTGCDDSIDERVETLNHKMDTLMERDECLFNKLHSLKDDMQELAKSNADKHNRLAMTVSNLKDSIECSKENKNKLDISSASFNVYFENKKKEDDDDE